MDPAVRTPDVTGGARRHRTFGSGLACRFAGESQPERRAAPRHDVVEHQVAAHPAHERARDIEAKAAAVAARSAGGAALEPTEQPGTVGFLEAATAIGDGGPQGPLGRVDADVNPDSSLSVFHRVVEERP